MGIIQDFKNLGKAGQTFVIGGLTAAALIAGASFYASRSKPLEDRVEDTETQNVDPETGKHFYRFITGEFPREEKKTYFENKKTFDAYNAFLRQWVTDNKETLKGRKYAAPSEALQIAESIDDKRYAADIGEITEIEIDNAASKYKNDKCAFKIQIDKNAPILTPAEEEALIEEIEKEYAKTEADQDRYLGMAQNKIDTRRERLDHLWRIGEQMYDTKHRKDPDFQKQKAVFEYNK